MYTKEKEEGNWKKHTTKRVRRSEYKPRNNTNPRKHRNGTLAYKQSTNKRSIGTNREKTQVETPAKTEKEIFQEHFPQLTSLPAMEISIPDGPQYSCVIRSDDVDDEQSSVSDEETYNCDFYPTPLISCPTKLSVRNQIPRPNNNVSYERWELTYFEQILDLSSIFTEGVSKLGINMNFRDVDFLDNFGHFVRDVSSGEISPYIEELSEPVKNIYREFSIKRDDL